jgi:DNA polymerase-3 subunit gamma/tau
VVRMGKMITKLVDVPAHEIEMMKAQVKDVSEIYLNQILDMLFKEEAPVKLSTQPKLALEMAFIRIFQMKPALSIDTLIEKLDILRKEIAEHGPAPVYQAAPAEFQQVSNPVEDAVHEPPKPFPAPAPPGENQNRPAVAETSPLPQPSVKPEPVAPGINENPAKVWKNFLNTIAKSHPSLSALLTSSTLVNRTEQHLNIEISGSRFRLNMLKREKNMTALKKACHEFFGNPLDISIDDKLIADQRPANGTQTGQLKQEAINHPLVAEAIDTFRGKIVDVKILQEEQ